MKGKKIVALCLTAAMAIGTASLLAACNDEKTPGGNFVEDKTVYYAVGQSNGTDGSLYNQGGSDTGWAPEVADEDLTFVRDTTVTDENVFTLELKLYEGDAFKILHDFEGDWDSVQINISNWGDQMSGEGKDRVVKINDEVCFVTEGEGNVGSNIICAEGADGIYTITMKTFPGTETAPVLSATKKQAIPALTKMYLNSDVNDFGFSSNQKDFVMNNNNGVWTYMLNVTAEDLVRDETGKAAQTGAAYVAAQVKSIAGDDKNTVYVATADEDIKQVEIAGEGKVNLIPEGKWMITYTQSTHTVVIKEVAYNMYFRGSNMSWGTVITEADDAYKLNESADHTFWYGFLAVPAGATHEVKLYNSLTGTWYGDGEANYKLTEGIYYVKFNIDDEAITVEKQADGKEIIAVGTFEDARFAYAATMPKFTATEVSTVITATITFTDRAAEENFDTWGDAAAVDAISAWKPVFVTDETIDWDTNKVGNLFVKEAGTFTVSFNLNTHEAVYTPVAA